MFDFLRKIFRTRVPLEPSMPSWMNPEGEKPMELRDYLSPERPLKVLHLCHHDGCIDEIKGVADLCNIQLTSWNVLNLPSYFFDPATKGGNKLYNIDHERASRVWEEHQKFFNQFDAVLVSCTTALARIFLQNGWNKPLINWVAVRFDWRWGGDLKNPFPDPEFYQLLTEAKKQKNVFFTASSSYELFYAREKNIDLGERVINPCACYLKDEKQGALKKSQIFIHQRTEDVQKYHNSSFVISKLMKKLQIPVACYRYHDLRELAAFKGVLYLPYQWCTLAFFETLRLGVPTFVPSESFLLKMIKEDNYFYEESEDLTQDKLFSLAEWYLPRVRDVIIYFDSWEDLQKKVADLDHDAVHLKTLAYGKAQTREMVSRWDALFQEVRHFLNTDCSFQIKEKYGMFKP